MACKTNKVKRLYCYMVLAIVVLLAYLSNVPKTMANMIVAFSSALQQALRDARVRRLLRSNPDVTMEIDDGDEERVIPDLNELPLDAETLITILNSGDTTSLRAREHMNRLPASVSIDTRVEYVKREIPYGRLEASILKASALMDDYREDVFLRILAAGKNKPAAAVSAKNLELGLALKWTIEEHMNKVFELIAAGEKDVTKFLGSPFLKAWIKYNKNFMRDENSYSLLLTEYFLKRNSDSFLLAQQLAKAKMNDAAKGVATELEKLLITKWLNDGEPDDTVFKGLGLIKEGIIMFDSLEWDTWVSYLVMRYGTGVIVEEETAKLILSVMRNDISDVGLGNSFAATTSDKGQERAEALAVTIEREKSMRTPENPQMRPGENDGEGSATKRQRNGDGM